MKKHRNRWKNLSIRNKLAVCFVLVIILPVTAISFATLNIAKHLLDQKTQNYLNNVVVQTVHNVENELRKIEDLSFLILSNSDLQENLNKANEPTNPEYDDVVLKRQIERLLTSFVLFNDQVEAITLVSGSGKIYRVNKTLNHYEWKPEHQKKIEEQQGSMVWFETDPELSVFSAGRVINSLKTQKPMGYFVIYIKQSILENLVADASMTQPSTPVIIDEQGAMILHPDQTQLGQTLLQDYQSSGVGGGQTGLAKIELDEKEHYICYSRPMFNKWRFVTLTPTISCQTEIIAMQKYIILISVGVAVLSIAAAYQISHEITKPITKLSEATVRFGDGDFSAKCEIDSQEEIGRLAQQFNTMADKIHDLIYGVYQQEALTRQAELKSLQMQINPHFLYNTLEAVNWMARINGINEIGDAVKALGNLMRSTLSAPRFITIREELSNLNSYLSIQKYRYGDKLTATVAAQEDILDLYIPKLIIQPILENAIVHGIEQKVGAGTVSVSITKEQNVVTVCVLDDGVGMPAELTNQIINGEHPMQDEGHTLVGVYNVNTRLQMYFGKEFGLRLENNPGGGVLATISYPEIESPAEWDEKGKCDGGSL